MHFRKTGPVFKIDLNWTPPNQILWCDPNLRAQSLPSLRTQFPEIFQNIWQVDGRCNCSMNLYVNWLELEDRQAKSPSSCKARSRSLWRWQCRSQRGRDRMGARCSLQELGCGLSASGSPRGAKPFRRNLNLILKELLCNTSVACRRTSSGSIGLGASALTWWAPQDTKMFSGFDSL